MMTPLAPDKEFTPVSSQYSKVLRVRSIIALVCKFLCTAAAAFFLRDHLSPWWFALLAGVFLIRQGLAFVLANRRSHAIGYFEGEDELLVCSGIMFRSLETIPYGRMQQVDVEDGPLLRRYGLARVKLTTASSGATGDIPGVPLEEANRLRLRLTELGDARMEGL